MLEIAGRHQNAPRVAALLASRNGVSYIRAQILSLLWQQRCELTVFIRDDQSNDGTRDELTRLCEEFPDRIEWIDKDGQASGSPAQNFFRLLLALRGYDFDFVALSDQDDIWEEGKLARAIEVLRKTGCDGYSSNMLAFSTDGRAPFLLRKDHPETRFDHLFQTASAGCTYVLSRRLFDVVSDKLAANVPNPDIAHDLLIYAIARSHGFNWVRDRAAHVLYRQHNENVVGSRQGLIGLRARWELAREGWYRDQIVALEPYLSINAKEKALIDAVRRDRLSDRLWLASQARNCRRRWRESLAFAVLQLVGRGAGRG